ncbi:MAG: isocitrate/isopropylmalate dehydrogenase family protein [Actinobacteria bacterium]|nr:MAG: isocitrate/isopropylmalate dehydrogenase family protein [Actinomycetota bacterium]
MSYKITLLPGDGIGPEITTAMKKVVAATGVDIEFEELAAGEETIATDNTPLPDKVLESIKKNKVAIKGPITTPVGSGFRSVNVALRKKLDLYACLRPTKSIKGLKTPFKDIDLVIVRENTEDLYAGIERMINDDKAESIKIITRQASEKIAKFAFDYAKKYGRKKVTSVTKANIMKYTDGLFFEACREIAQRYPDIEYEERLIDAMSMQLVIKPNQYDVIVTENLYGDILSDLCAGLIGGLGVAPGANIGDDSAVFEPIHGSAPKHAGKQKVNPSALILSAALMFRHIGENDAANKVEDCVNRVISEGKTITYDLGGTATTQEMAEAIADKVKNR